MKGAEGRSLCSILSSRGSCSGFEQREERWRENLGRHREPGVLGPLQKVGPCCPALTQPLCPASVNPSLVKVHIHHPPEASVQVHQVARVRGEAPEENSVETRPSPWLPASPRHSHWDSNSIPVRSGEAPQPRPPAAPRPPGRLGRCYLSSVNGQVRTHPLPQPYRLPEQSVTAPHSAPSLCCSSSRSQCLLSLPFPIWKTQSIKLCDQGEPSLPPGLHWIPVSSRHAPEAPKGSHSGRAPVNPGLSWSRA